MLKAVMAAPNDVRARVSRILNGGRNSSDLHRLFEWARFRTRGKFPVVKDIGDFGAHRDTRDKGVAWRRGVIFCNSIAWHHGEARKDGPRDVSLMGEVARSCLADDTDREIRDKFRANRRLVSKALENALSKVERMDGSDLYLLRPLTPLEAQAFDYYRQRFFVRPAFTEQDVIKQTSGFLIENELLEPDTERLSPAGDWLVAYVVMLMHDTVLLQSEQRRGRLRAAISEDRLSVQAMIEVDGIGVVSNIFEVETPAHVICTERLLAVSSLEGVPLDLNGDGRLDYLL